MTDAVAEHPLPMPMPAELRAWIADMTTVAAPGAVPGPYTFVPDPAVKLVVRTAADGRRDAMVVGPRTRASYHAPERPASCVRLSLAPGATRPLLGVPAVDLVGRVVPLDALPGPATSRLADRLRAFAPDELAERLAEVLPRTLPKGADRERAELLRAGVAELSVREGRAPAQVAETARRLAVSERQLRKLFTEGIGLSPKHYARIERVRHVLARAAGVSWAELAVASGYYDQAHMTADFRSLMGVPPRAYVTGRLPGARPCQAWARG
ncbi:helix-turn-helix domain-containing protein [Streptomyces sp. NPDC001595]|uniref:AraC family transcriptional regulator n=1 Tax=Streptomyces sp. NPDC001532 TaxID=3154520 RepID=UPI003331DE51